MKKKIGLLLFLFVIMHCYGVTLVDADFGFLSGRLKIYGNDIECEKITGNSFNVKGNKIHIDYSQGSYSTMGDDGLSHGACTTLKINGQEYSGSSYDSDILLTKSVLYISVVNGGSVGDITIYVENIAPKLSVTGVVRKDGSTISKEYKSNTIMDLTEDDSIFVDVKASDASGIKRITCNGNEVQWPLKYAAKTHKGDTLTIEAENNVGLKAKETFTVKFDSSAPVIECDFPKTWVKESFSIKPKIKDNETTLKSSSIEINKNGQLYKTYPNKETKQIPSEIKLLETGIYDVRINAENNLGLKSGEVKGVVKIDRDAPSIKTIVPTITRFSGQGTTLNLKSEIEDKDSGLSAIKVSLKDNSTQKLIPIIEEASIGGKAIYTVNKEIKIDMINVFDLVVWVKDISGNISEKIVEVNIPKNIEVTSFESKIVNRSTGSVIQNKMKTNLSTVDDLKSYVLSYKREFELGDEKTFVKEKELSKKVELKTGKQVVKENDGVFVIDEIPVAYGVGHHKVKYTFECTTLYAYEEKNVAAKIQKHGSFKDYVIQEKLGNTYCANNICEVIWKLSGKDKSGVEHSLEIDGSKEFRLPQGEEIYTNQDGTVTLSVKVRDNDYEKHDIQLYKYLYGNGEQIKIPVEKMIIEKYATYGTNTEFKAFSVPLYLLYNMAENYGIEVLEYVMTNDESSRVLTKTEQVALKAEAPDLGGFKLSVDKADYNAKGITVHVNTEVELAIEEKDNSRSIYIINWGDKDNTRSKELYSGDKACFTYRQKDGRTGPTSEYKMTVTKGKDSKTEFSVFAVDTQYGDMAGDEEWIGEHIILSSIRVPKKYTLTINGNKPKEEQISSKVQVLVYWNPSVKSVELKVEGTLATRNKTDGIIFVEMNNTSSGFVVNTIKNYGWGGIVAEAGAKVALENCEIKYADRGITVKGDGADVKLNRVYLHDNDIGLHVVGGRKVEIKESRIENNRKYGIKEDKNGNESPEVIRDKNTTVKENGYTGRSEYPRDHYKAEDGLKVTE